MYKIYKEGDSSRGPCEKCRKLVKTTFRYAPLKINGATVPDVLQDFCNECGASVSIPHQSTYRIREFRQANPHVFELRVPGHLVDILLAIGMTRHVSSRPNSLCRLVAELYLSHYGRPGEKDVIGRILSAVDDELAAGKSSQRLSCLFPDAVFASLKALSDQEKVTASALMKGIIVAAKRDLLDNRDKKLGREFELLAAMKL